MGIFPLGDGALADNMRISSSPDIDYSMQVLSFFLLKRGDALACHYGNITMRLTRFCHADILMDNIKGRRHG